MISKITQAGAYGKNGDQHGRLIVFERNEPEFPGLIFETPAPPEAGKSQELQFFRPDLVLKRMPGKLYYAVILDVAASIEEPAVKDLMFTLRHLAVE